MYIMTDKYTYHNEGMSAGERSAYANGYEAGLTCGITQGIEHKVKGIKSIIEDTSLTDHQVRLLLARMCRLELLEGTQT
jgi:hypothetical protein